MMVSETQSFRIRTADDCHRFVSTRFHALFISGARLLASVYQPPKHHALVLFIGFVAVLLWTVGIPVQTLVHADEFPKIYNSEQDRDAAPMDAATAAVELQVPEGCRAQVFASEPDVQNPIAHAWDARGRMWVAENFTYAERNQRFDLNLRDRVLIFADTNHDGIADSRTVFTDQVQRLTGMEVGRGGVYLMCPPQLLFIPDANDDDVPDALPKVLLDGFTVAQQSHHNFANGLRWGPDGWLYGRCGGSCPGRVGVPTATAEQRVALEGGIWRFNTVTKVFEVLVHGTTNPWGHDWDMYGEMFFCNTVNGHLWHLIPGAHLDRPFTLDPNPHAYQLLDMHADHWHFDTGQKWHETRATSDSYGGGHAHQGVMIYQGNDWPLQYRNRLLTFNFHGRRANQEIIDREGSGFVVRHGDDILQSTDPFFRGIDLSYGPDGAVYILDWSDTGECHENTGVHRTSGRVYKVSSKPAERSSIPAGRAETIDLRQRTNQELVDLLTHPNAWFERHARIVLTERALSGKDTNEAIHALRNSVTAGDTVVSHRALATLHCMNTAGKAASGTTKQSHEGEEASAATETEFLEQQLDHTSEQVRVWAIRFLVDSWPIDDIHGPNSVSAKHSRRVASEANRLIQRFCEIARRDSSASVRLTLASTLQRLPLDLRPLLANALTSRREDADDHNLPLLVWYGLMAVGNEDSSLIAGLVKDCQWPKTQRLIARRVGEDIQLNPKAVEAVLAVVVESTDSAEQNNIMQGLADGMKGWKKAPAPSNWQSVTRVIQDTEALENAANATGRTNAERELVAIVRELSLLFGDGRAFESIKQVVLDSSIEIGIRRSALQALVKTNEPELRDICLQLLGDPRINVVAAEGLSGLDDPEVAVALVRNYNRFRSPERPGVIAILVSRVKFANVLLNAIAKNKIPVSALTAFDVRQIHSLGDDKLSHRVAELWGHINESPEDVRKQISSLRQLITDENRSSVNASAGRQLYDQSCSKCHRLFGAGADIGPDLTGSNRANLDYLLENIIDPSAVVSKDFVMSIVSLADGRVLNGLVVSKNTQTITLQTQTESVTVHRDEIDDIETSELSPMPNGLIDNLSPQQQRDLFEYLQQPSQVPPPGE